MNELITIGKMVHHNCATLCRRYVETFPVSYLKYASRHPIKSVGEDLTQLHEHYATAVDSSFKFIRSKTSVSISDYLRIYKVQPGDGFCKYKEAFFYGMAMHGALGLEKNAPPPFLSDRISSNDLKNIHMYSLIGILHDVLVNDSNTEPRPQMARALIELVDKNLLSTHLGDLGVYLLFKCRGPVPNSIEVVG